MGPAARPQADNLAIDDGVVAPDRVRAFFAEQWPRLNVLPGAKTSGGDDPDVCERAEAHPTRLEDPVRIVEWLTGG